MEASLIRLLSAVVAERRTKPPKAAMTWLQDNGLIVQAGKGPRFKHGAHETIDAILRSQGIGAHLASTLSPDESRSAARRKAAYEKVGQHILARNRVLVRAAPGRPLLVGGSIDLPPGSSVDIDASQILRGLGHQQILLVENRECFDHLENLMFRPEAFELDPLVVFRGSPFVSSASSAFLASARLPVHVFSDYDPAGVVIAADTPCAVSYVKAPETLIEAEIARAPNHDLHEKQMTMLSGRGASLPEWLRADWLRITLAHCAIPQESFLLPERDRT